MRADGTAAERNTAMRHPLLTALGLALLTVVGPVAGARAVMGSATIMARVDTDGDGTLSRAEVRSAASKRYDLIKSKNGGRVTQLQLGGRVTASEMKKVGLAPGLSTVVGKDAYLALADRFFDEADMKKNSGAAAGGGSLDAAELGSPAGEKLIGLLQ